jgi:hypothetical protein
LKDLLLHPVSSKIGNQQSSIVNFLIGNESIGFAFDRGISEPCAVSQLKDTIVELLVFYLGQDPFQACKNAIAIGLAKRDYDNSEVALESMRDGVEKIPIRGEQNGSVVLGFLEHFGIVNPLVAGSAKIEDFMSCRFEEGDRRLREILVEQELHA